MALDFCNEQIITLAEAARHIPTVNGKRVHVASLWRWSMKGLSGIRLEHGRLGRRVVTSREAIGRFMNRLADADECRLSHPPSMLPQPRTTIAAQREASIAQAHTILAKHGI
jgi:hypothetical protein